MGGVKRPCITAGCSKRAAPNQRRCYRCAKRRYREAHPIRSCWQTLKDNARRRGVAFSLPLQDFVTFIENTDYMLRKGKVTDSLQIDRIEREKGYRIDNIQCLTLQQNVAKYYEEEREEYPF